MQRLFHLPHSTPSSAFDWKLEDSHCTSLFQLCPWLPRSLAQLMSVFAVASEFECSLILKVSGLCLNLGFPSGTSGKEPACQCRCGFYAWVGKIPWRRAWQPTLVFLPGEFQGQRSLWAVESQRVGHGWSDLAPVLSWLGPGKAVRPLTTLWHSCLSTPSLKRLWWAGLPWQSNS